MRRVRVIIPLFTEQLNMVMKIFVDLWWNMAHVWTRLKNSAGKTPSHYAANGGYLEACRVLVEEGGADVNSKSNNGRIPLHYATTWRQVEIIAYLQSTQNTAGTASAGRSAKKVKHWSGSATVAAIEATAPSSWSAAEVQEWAGAVAGERLENPPPVSSSINGASFVAFTSAET